MKISDLIVVLGSNVEEAFFYFQRVQMALKKEFKSVRSSCFRYTPAVNFVRDCLFLNQVLVIEEVDWDKRKLADFLKKFEEETPRSPDRVKQGWVDLDVDMLCWKGERLKNEDFFREDIQDALFELGLDTYCLKS